MRLDQEMALIYRSLLHVRCPDCGKDILFNYARPLRARACLCGRHVEISPAEQSRFFSAAPFEELPVAGA